jgi:hypothetical protein
VAKLDKSPSFNMHHTLQLAAAAAAAAFAHAKSSQCLLHSQQVALLGAA